MKVQRLALVVAATVVGAIPAKAEEMRATEARQFIAGKHFSYSCFDGTNGNGRIYADGSVAGYIQPGGSGPRRYVVLPTGTLRTSGDRYCASVRGLPFEPCFNIDRTSQVSLLKKTRPPTNSSKMPLKSSTACRYFRKRW